MLHRFLPITCLALASVATAQTGSTPPRVVDAATTQQWPEVKGHFGSSWITTIVELSVGVDTRVADVKVVESSGDAQLDQTVASYYKKWRFIPAVDEHGTPVAGTIRMQFKIMGDQRRPPASAPAAPSESKVNDEVARISRMRCQDFLWEYDLMKEIAGRHSINREQLFDVSVAMFIARHQVTDSELVTIGKIREAAIRESVEKCRTAPTEKFWSDAFEPALASRLGH